MFGVVGAHDTLGAVCAVVRPGFPGRCELPIAQVSWLAVVPHMAVLLPAQEFVRCGRRRANPHRGHNLLRATLVFLSVRSSIMVCPIGGAVTASRQRQDTTVMREQR